MSVLSVILAFAVLGGLAVVGIIVGILAFSTNSSAGPDLMICEYCSNAFGAGAETCPACGQPVAFSPIKREAEDQVPV